MTITDATQNVEVESPESSEADRLRAEISRLGPNPRKSVIRAKLSDMVFRLTQALNEIGSLQAKLDNLKKERQALSERYEAALQLQQIALVLIFDMKGAIERLTNESLTDPSRSDDGRVVTWSHPFFTVVLDVFRNPNPVLEIVPPASGDAARPLMGIKSIPIVDGRLPVNVQDEILGFIRRLVTVGEGGQDPSGNAIVFGVDGHDTAPAAA